MAVCLFQRGGEWFDWLMGVWFALGFFGGDLTLGNHGRLAEQIRCDCRPRARRRLSLLVVRDHNQAYRDAGGGADHIAGEVGQDGGETVRHRQDVSFQSAEVPEPRSLLQAKLAPEQLSMTKTGFRNSNAPIELDSAPSRHAGYLHFAFPEKRA